ncbi:isocitrate lyase/phosphoenolpyruvate mutase family protein [Phenylobacterium sp.]|uniref:isocitrate lyase/PEP mutase family protein n=1 Tax=Phenylobacterium sp. TaxID=1871053 RepID=UPI00272F42F9|nr:isocitrate lyase/phosphoenolpyruvate mutase family protein [Phenylobacterium sp.]MDP1619357.1 isocitrate lyase/phosphoenolpyruvate mutase family protein [Phenylobacterium sp.]MDP1987480.1 isocitrate lyase/phosphoenolpyruvate mutase family protein [Phenylobacterium sp.]
MTDHAAAFHALHTGPDLLILPNAWDAASAALMASAGAKAVATSSAAVAWAQGFPDGDALPTDRLIAVIADVVRVTSVPVTADIEGGYTDDLAELSETIRRVAGAGAVGISLEDGARDPDLHARKIAAARAAADAEGVALYINARTDIYLRDLAQGEAALTETLRRATLYLDAGASGLFVPGPADEAVIGALADGVQAPLNIMLRPTTPPAERLAALGVRRLSSATAPFRAAYGALVEALPGYLETGTFGALTGRGALPDLDGVFGG